MLIKGEKYACEACVRGHRVSNCQHADRPLQHINRKGRPISQCTHCRILRKNRSAHVRCDCGEKAHSKGACTHEGGDSHGEHLSEETCEAPQELSLTIDIAENCCCSHGARCSCALRKEHLDPVLESDSDECSSEARFVAPAPAQSKEDLTVRSAAHKNQMKSGFPYVKRAHSIHSRSPARMANRSVDNLPHTSTIDALHSESHIKDSIVSAQQEQLVVKSKSEHGSPLMSPMSNLNPLDGLLPPLDLSIPGDFNFYSMPDPEQPLFSAGLSAASIDWSHYDGLNFNDDFAASSYSQAPSFTGFEFSSMDQPALTTTSTSGEISEVEDFGPVGDNHAARPALLNHYGSDFENSDFGGDIDGYRLSTASSYIDMPQAQMLASTNVEALDIDDFLKGVATSHGYHNTNHGVQVSCFAEDSLTKTAQTQVPSSFDDSNNFQFSPDDEDQAFWMNDFTSSNHISITTATPGGRVDGLQEGNVWAQ